MNLVQELEQEVGVLKDEIKPYAALLWNGLKNAVAKGEQIVLDDVKAKLPDYVTGLKAIAASAVMKVEQDATMGNLWAGAKYAAAVTALIADVINGGAIPVASLSESLVAGVINDMVTLVKTEGIPALLAIIQAA